MSISAHIVYSLAWLSFGLLHSILAGPRAKQFAAPVLGSGYRFAYNLFAIIYIGAVIYGGRYLLGTALKPFALPEGLHSLLVGAMILGVLIFLAALSQYDLGRFAGITQLLRPSDAATIEPLQLRGLNRYVRHPLYTGAHLYLWGAVRTEFDLVTAIWASAYLIIGSHFEEKKLIADYGEPYVAYKKRVPSVIPWRGRAI